MDHTRRGGLGDRVSHRRPVRTLSLYRRGHGVVRLAEVFEHRPQPGIPQEPDNVEIALSVRAGQFAKVGEFSSRGKEIIYPAFLTRGQVSQVGYIHPCAASLEMFGEPFRG